MARIKWEYQQADGSWTGLLGNRIAFRATPDVDSWELRFVWTGSTFGPLSNVGKTREVAEQKLVLFAESTGMTLPEDVEEELSLAQDLVERVKGEMRWFKDGDTDEERAHYMATQVLVFFADWVHCFKAEVDKAGGDREWVGAQETLAKMHEQLLESQEDLGVEVEREGR